MSRSASLILAAVLGGAVVAGVAWVTRPAVAPAPHAPSPIAHSVTLPPSARTAIESTPSQVSPWAGGSGVVARPSPSGIASAISVSPKDPEKARRRAAIRARLTQMTAGGRQPTLAEVSGVLADLEHAEGSAIVAGVNIGALRSNLLAVDKLQKLSMQLQAESHKPGGGDKQKIQDILVQLKQVQASMHLNVNVATPAAVPNR